jgi:DNA-binding NarL/FixJ family response regulator
MEPSAHRGAPRVVVFDGQPMFRCGLSKLLLSHGVDVLAQASSPRDALASVALLAPDLVVAGLEPPVGAALVAELLACDVRTRVLVLAAHADDGLVTDAVRAGACGFVLKEAPAAEIVASVHAAAAGLSPVSPGIAGSLLDCLRRSPGGTPSEGFSQLTPREVEVLRLVADGKDNAEIGRELFLSPCTVKHHVSRILRKLSAENRVQAAVRAVRAGVV